MPLKVELRSLILRYLVMLLSELTALMNCSPLKIADFAKLVSLSCFSMFV